MKKCLFLIRFLSLFLVGLGLVFLMFFSSFVNASEIKISQTENTLKFAVKDNLRPLGFRDNTGSLQGLEIDIAHKLAEELVGDSQAVEFIPVLNKDRLDVILQDKVNFTIAHVTATETRGRLVEFSIPYYLDGAGFITKDSNIKKFQDISKQRIVVINNSDTIANIKYFIPNAKLIGADTYQAAKTIIDKGEAAAFAGDASILAGWVQEYPEYHILPTLLTAEPLSIVMPKGLQYANLRLQVNYAIQAWKADGWLQNRLQYWGLPMTKDSFSSFEMLQ